MGLIQTFRDVRQRSRATKASEVTQEFKNQLFSSPICSDYENVFAQVRPLVDAMVQVKPYGVGRNGARLSPARTPELNLLDDPNENMGGVEFADTMFSTWLTEDNLYVHVHKKRNGSIIGYTLLPPDSKVTSVGAEPYWQIWTNNGSEIFRSEIFHADEVMELHYSRNPRNLKGVSPAGAVRVYAQIDDLLAQFEKAYLENGAIPASVTIIRASTQAKFNEARAELERQLKGAGNRNKTLYLWRQFNNDDGTEKDQVEVKTIQGNNNTLAIHEIVEVINDRLNKAYGVSNFIMGDDSSAKYDNAELSDFQFTRRRVKPALVKFWAQFQHELDRITGGLGYAIDFHLDEPELTERKKVMAETDEKVTQNLIRLIEAGARPSDACAALDLSVDKWLNVAVGIYTRVLAEKQAERSLAVTQSQETQKAPIKDQSPLYLLSHSCQHHHETDYYQPFGDDEVVERKIFDQLMELAEAIAAEDETFDMDQAAQAIYELLRKEAERGGVNAIEELAKIVDKADIEKLKELLTDGGIVLSEGLKEHLRQRTAYLVEGFSKHAQDVIESALSGEEPLSASEIKKRLAEVMPKGRAATIARNETVYAFKSGSLEADEQAANELGLEVELTWHARKDGITCDVCAAMDGQTTMLGDKYTNSITLQEGDRLINGRIVGEAPEGATDEERRMYTGKSTFGYIQNEWNDNGEIPNAHTNCRCYYTRKIVGKTK